MAPSVALVAAASGAVPAMRAVSFSSAAIALDTDDAQEAVRLAERGLRHLPLQNRAERAPLVEIVARAHAAAGALDHARALAAELKETARIAGTAPLAAATSATDGAIAAAAGDHESARRHLEHVHGIFE